MKDRDMTVDEVLPADQQEKKSKTQRKKEMIELQKLGEVLVGLPKAYLNRIGLPPDLLEAVLYAKVVPTHSARRRQMQRIGVLMREADRDLVEKALADFRQGK
ncbi:MAG TPA: ribosome biogenesis factor YjgA [Deltaproteobacteria bacterium]|nr:ribosome biogenesis factor YjgA [Deltaproteobacteria bacterium]